ncbi:MAG: right-handed parallel beta-helix repeat-containing protein [candidate division Zixibacteria bacterium]|nr:right-handed parallel beta-helix repeat-containing protein [candidate division Zixibacteria bacterium]
MNRALFAALFCTLCLSTVQAAIIHVPGDSATIQAGINGAVTGDTVLVSPGTYWVNLDYGGKSIVVTSEAGPLVTWLRPDSAHLPVVWFHNDEPRTAVLSGFSIMYAGGGASGVRIRDASPTVTENHFRFHSSNTPWNAAVNARGTCSTMVSHNIFYDSPSANPAVHIYTGDTIQFINNTLYNCHDGVEGSVAPAIIRNNIITNGGGHGFQGYYTLIEDYNNSWGNGTNYYNFTPDPTDISVDPLFIDPANGCFYLQPTSPCIDAGNPAAMYNDPDGTRNDMGAAHFDQNPPRALFVNLDSEDVAHVINHSPVFHWFFYDPVGSPTGYEIEVGMDNDWLLAETWATGQVYSSDTSAAYTGSALVDSMTYYYRLRVYNGSSWGGWYESVFRMNTLPTTPAPVWPTSPDLVSILDVHLVTTNADHPWDNLTYDFEIYADPGLSVIADSTYGTEEQENQTTSRRFVGLAVDTEYWWRCRVFNGYEYSAWSTTESFSTRTPMVIHVPSGQPTIQAAIDWAQNYDTVLVADGVFTGPGNYDIDFHGKPLTVMSENGPESTTIDCEGSAGSPRLAFILQSGEDTTSIIQGFTITGAWSDDPYGEGAVNAVGASVSVRDCIITRDSCMAINAYWWGDGKVIISDCIVTHNTGWTAVHIYGLEATITNCEIAHNDQMGLHVHNTQPIVLEGTLVHHNDGFGALLMQAMGIYGIDVHNCTFAANDRGLAIDWSYPKEGEDAVGMYQDTCWITNVLSAFNEQHGMTFYAPGEYQINCNNSFGNGGEDFYGIDTVFAGDDFNNISVNPLFCDTTAHDYRPSEGSVCAPANNSCGVLIGALEPGDCSCCVVRGDVDHSGIINIADLTYLVAYMFTGGPPPPCTEEGNVDGQSGKGPINIADVTYLVCYLFLGSCPPPPCP